MTFIIYLIVFSYGVLIGVFILGFLRIPRFKSKKSSPTHSFSVIIPFRNEAANLPQLLESIASLNYPREMYEILMIDDASTDQYLSITNGFTNQYPTVNLKVINNTRKSVSPKKDAIETGIQHANFKWILTTDADCSVPNLWLNSYNEYLQKNDVVFIAGPVTFKESNSFLDRFQLLDFSALIGSTVGGFGIGKPFLCNGANLCYSKSAFQSVDGYSGNNGIASGDDLFLLEKIAAKFPKQIGYIKSPKAMVFTNTAKNLKDLISQRVRWASKTSNYTNSFPRWVALIIIVMNILFCTSIAALFLSNSFIVPLTIGIITKLIVDFILIGLTLDFKRKTFQLIYYPLISCIHPFFNVWVGLITFTKKNYQWKNRTFSK